MKLYEHLTKVLACSVSLIFSDEFYLFNLQMNRNVNLHFPSDQDFECKQTTECSMWIYTQLCFKK